MVCLPDFPCKGCHFDSCHINVAFKLHYIFQSLLEESIYLANNVVNHPLPDYNVMNDVERHMHCTLSSMLERFFRKYPEKLNFSSDNINNLIDIYPVLKQRLNERIILGESYILRRELASAFILPMPYQCFVLESLILAGKCAVKCMNKFRNDDLEIFNNVLNTLIDFFKESNITSWILHISQVMHPFGTVGCIQQQEITQNVDELCMQFCKNL